MDRWFAVPPTAPDDGGTGGSVELPTAGTVYPVSGYGLISASGVPEAFRESSGFGPGSYFLVRTWIPAGTPITSLWVAVHTGGSYTSGSPNLLALYDGDGQPLGVTADDPALWAQAGWRGGPIVGGPVPAEPEGRWMYIGIVATGYSGILLPYALAGAHGPWFGTGASPQPRRLILASGANLPASFDPSTHGMLTSYLPLVGVA